MTNRLASRVAAISGFLAVSLGAFGAHALEKLLLDNKTLEIWRTAVLYHLAHSLMLFILAREVPLRIKPWISFLIGILLFSGSLYVLAVTGVRRLGAITPLGGVSFLLGWLFLIVAPVSKDAKK